jgi:biotin transport system ATP-binding protein
MIKAENLSYTYPQNSVPSVRGLTFNISEGNLVCVLGNNGSGKTTLLHILAGLLKAEGCLNIMGSTFAEKTDELRAGLALLPQEPDLYILGSTVAEDLSLSPAWSNAATKDRAMDLAGRFGLDRLMERPVHTLSHGEKRKLCLASALFVAPRLLLRDEPLAGLDYPAKLELRRIIAMGRTQGITQIISLHDLEMLGDLADACLVLREGEMALQGCPDEIFPALDGLDLKTPCWWRCGHAGPLDIPTHWRK